MPVPARRGSLIVLALGAALAVLAGLSWRELLALSRERFIVTVQTVPESEGKLRADRPLVVQISGAALLRAPRPAVAYLLAGDGAVLAGPLALAPAPHRPGRAAEGATFPPLLAVPPGGMVTALVLRLPDAGPAVLARLTGALRREAGDRDLQRLLGHVLDASHALGGHAEWASAEVR